MRKRSYESYINEFNEIHKNRYIYPKQEIKRNSKIKIICPYHGEFKINTSSHLKGFGCPKCSIKKRLPRKSKNDHIKDFNKIHKNKYNYSLYIDSEKNFKTNEKIPIICKRHGIFYQTIRDHKQGQGCPYCAQENYRKPLKSLSKHINDFKKVHGDKYDYSLVLQLKNEITNTFYKIPIICPIHGIFYQKINDHKQGQGCPKCNESKGERKIRQYLEKNNINYIYQYKIKYQDRNFYFDFYIPELNLAIEYDGIFHFESPSEIFENEVQKQKERDKFKNQYCHIHNINLLRIPYWDFKKIDEILDQAFKRA